MTVNYVLTIALPIEQVFVKAEKFEDCVQDALDEALQEEYIDFREYGDLTEDEDIELYNIYAKKGVEAFMRHCKFSMDNLTAIVEYNIIRYIVRVELDVDDIFAKEGD